MLKMQDFEKVWIRGEQKVLLTFSEARPAVTAFFFLVVFAALLGADSLWLRIPETGPQPFAFLSTLRWSWFLWPFLALFVPWIRSRARLVLIAAGWLASLALADFMRTGWQGPLLILASLLLLLMILGDLFERGRLERLPAFLLGVILGLGLLGGFSALLGPELRDLVFTRFLFFFPLGGLLFFWSHLRRGTDQTALRALQPGHFFGFQILPALSRDGASFDPKLWVQGLLSMASAWAFLTALLMTDAFLVEWNAGIFSLFGWLGLVAFAGGLARSFQTRLPPPLVRPWFAVGFIDLFRRTAFWEWLVLHASFTRRGRHRKTTVAVEAALLFLLAMLLWIRQVGTGPGWLILLALALAQVFFLRSPPRNVFAWALTQILWLLAFSGLWLPPSLP